jgi:hypothetical protein
MVNVGHVLNFYIAGARVYILNIINEKRENYLDRKGNILK